MANKVGVVNCKCKHCTKPAPPNTTNSCIPSHLAKIEALQAKRKAQGIS